MNSPLLREALDSVEDLCVGSGHRLANGVPLSDVGHCRICSAVSTLRSVSELPEQPQEVVDLMDSECSTCGHRRGRHGGELYTGGCCAGADYWDCDCREFEPPPAAPVVCRCGHSAGEHPSFTGGGCKKCSCWMLVYKEEVA